MNMKTIGIAGGGQLGRMLAEAARGLGCKVVILDPTPNSPAAQVADGQIVADYKNADAMFELSRLAGVLTYEIESVNAEALEELSARGVPVHPTPKTLSIIKDKLKQKEFLAAHKIPVAPFCQFDISNPAPSIEKLGLPLVLKARSGGFDGRGNATVKSEADIPKAMKKLGGQALYAEGFVKFEKELAIIAARTVDGKTAVYPLVETIHKHHICHTVMAPAAVAPDIAAKAHALAEKVLGAFEGAGVFGIEMFLTKDGEVLVNEVAPRVHNSGHFSIEASHTSQFEEHIRAITGMELGDPSMKVPAAVMVNILGEREGPAEPRGVEEAEKIEGVKVHIYGKMETRKERKMGHLTAVADTLEEAEEKAKRARAIITI
jgi:5-(carboxyamino)imidazole ribonucleotide synthase